MKIVNKNVKYRKANVNNIPNVMAFTFIRNWLSDKKYESERCQYFIGNLSQQQVSSTMKEIKWLARTYRDLDIITIEDKNGNLTQISL